MHQPAARAAQAAAQASQARQIAPPRATKAERRATTRAGRRARRAPALPPLLPPNNLPPRNKSGVVPSRRPLCGPLDGATVLSVELILAGSEVSTVRNVIRPHGF